MDEPDGGCSWQAWKFGMKREDLYTKLQDQYNTVTLSIQDPDAFHNDVREISKVATDLDEFHRLLEQRKQLRLDQLNESLQSASVEIIANPQLIGTDQWQHAIQLFRTRSYDSLVRYFSSYLPEDHKWDASVQDATTKSYFNEEMDDPIHLMTYEPMPYISGTAHKIIPASHLPPSPRSLTMCSDSSNISTPARTLSFSEPDTDTDVMLLSTTLTAEYDDETSQYDEPDTPTTPMSEISDANPLEYPYLTRVHLNKNRDTTHDTQISLEELPESQSPDWLEDSAKESETPTPTPRESTADSYMPQEAATPLASKPTPPSSKYTPLERRIREVSPGSARVRRRSPEIGRIQKPSSDPIRARHIGLKR